MAKKGGSKGPSSEDLMAQQLKMTEAMRPKDIALDTTSWGGMGYNLPANPMQMGSAALGQGLNAPAWMTGDWAMPSWGQAAPNVGAALLQQQMGQGQYGGSYDQMRGQAPAPAPAPAQAVPTTPSRAPRSSAKAQLREMHRMGGRTESPYYAWMDNNG